nr:MAG TPA: Putative endo-beta-N-acetylglucosaminidase surface protein [Caudoviricetes sp.]
MSKSIKINGTTYNGVPSVAIPLADDSGEAIFRDASEVIDTPTATKPITANGEYDVTNFAKVAVAVSGEAPTLQSKSVTPGTSAQTVTPDSGYDGLSQVTVGAVQVQEKSVTPGTSAQTVTPDAGKYLSKVTVEAVAGAPVLSALGVSPTAVTVPAGTAADGIKSYLTAMSGTYTLTGYAGTLTKDLTSAISSATVSGTMPTAGNTSAMTISYGGKSAIVSVTMEAAAPTLTGLSATYTGGTVAAGTTLSQLTEVVKATYSDGTTSAALTKGTDYTLSGTLTAGQANTVTVTGTGTYAGFTTSFSVTVEGAAAVTSSSATGSNSTGAWQRELTVAQETALTGDINKITIVMNDDLISSASNNNLYNCNLTKNVSGNWEGSVRVISNRNNESGWRNFVDGAYATVTISGGKVTKIAIPYTYMSESLPNFNARFMFDKDGISPSYYVTVESV